MSAPAPTTEIVTAAKVRLLDLPFDAGRAALITLDNGLDHRKPNTFGLGGLRALGDALEEVRALADSGEIVAAAVTGKPFVFAVGADLTGLPYVTTREQAHSLERSATPCSAGSPSWACPRSRS